MKYLKFKGFLPILLILISLILCFQNYKAGTYLSGWDTLHPEFNFGLYFKRIFFGVWQEHQGLGAVAAQSHAGELPRMLFYYPLSFIFPDIFLRYSYFFITLVVGPLGIYFFLKHITKKAWVSFCGALVYLLNLGTLQHFYLPLEMFATHFATLPWLILFATKFLQYGQRKDLLLFSLFTILAAPSSHTPTLFYAYFLGLSVYVIANILLNRKKLLPGIIILTTSLILNSFWLLPNIYFVRTHGIEVSGSKIHSQFFNRASLISDKFANLKDGATLRGFLFDWGEYDDSKKSFVDLFDEWKGHLNNPFISSIGYLVFAIVLLGILASFFKKEIVGITLLPLFLLTFLIITTNASVLSSFGILKEALRFQFSKFSIMLMFTFAIYFGIALSFFNHKLAKFVLTIIVFVALTIYMLPAFKGNLISPSMKVKIPNEYFATFDWFKDQKMGSSREAGRIAHFPVHTFWGWVYYSWGYEGAGFLWFGLNQPLLDREFDRWSSYNENYYWEISYALYSKNQRLLEAVLQKYHINWLLLDGNVFNPSSAKSVYFEEIEKMLSASNKVQLAQTFGKIKIYRVNLDAPLNNFVYLSENLPALEPEYKWGNFDRAFLENGNYLSIPASSYYYPFRTLFSGKTQKDLEFEIEDRGDYFAFRKTVPKGFENYFLQIPEIQDEELVWVDPADLNKTKAQLSEVYFNGEIVEAKVPKIGGLFSAQLDGSKKRDFLLENLPHEFSYLITVESKNLMGKPFVFWLENINSKRVDIETYLPARPAGGPELPSSTSHFIQPPMEPDGIGYAINFEEVQFGNEKSKNELGKITLNPIPFDFLTGLKLRKADTPLQPKLTTLEVEHPNPSTYHISLPGTDIRTLENPVIILSQSFEPGWKAYVGAPFFGKEIKDHVLVNNWANGWILKTSELSTTYSKLTIVFLPQYLEFLGMFSALFWIILVLCIKKI